MYLSIVLVVVAILGRGDGCPQKPCKADWPKSNETGFCYYFGTVAWTNTSTVDQVQATCQNMDASLASVHSQAENDFIVGYYPTGTAENVILGITRVVPGSTNNNFKYFDGTQYDYNNFEPGREPDGGDCAYMVTNAYAHLSRGQWYDVPCTYPANRFVCKSLPP